MKHKIIIFIPWFGELPAIFQAWKMSVLHNSDIDFWLFTDTDVVTDRNLYVQHMTFESFVDGIRDLFDFPIVCEHPYKLCDYKPIYGELCQKIIEAGRYDFWGYCDMDMIYGDIRKFLTSDILEKYDKIFVDAHLSLFRNDEKMKHLFREQGTYPEYNFGEVYQTNRACYFDEYRGMELKCIRKCVRVFNNRSIYSDPCPSLNKYFKNGKQIIYIWSKGQLYSVDNCGNREELLYAHIKKRKMESVICQDNDQFVVLPGKIIPFSGEVAKECFEYSSENMGKVYYKIVWLSRRFVAKLKTSSFLEIMRERKRMKDCMLYKEELLKKFQEKVED